MLHLVFFVVETALFQFEGAHGKDIRNGLADITAVADVQRLLDNARQRLAA